MTVRVLLCPARVREDLPLDQLLYILQPERLTASDEIAVRTLVHHDDIRAYDRPEAERRAVAAIDDFQPHGVIVSQCWFDVEVPDAMIDRAKERGAALIYVMWDTPERLHPRSIAALQRYDVITFGDMLVGVARIAAARQSAAPLLAPVLFSLGDLAARFRLGRGAHGARRRLRFRSRQKNFARSIP